MKFLFQAAVLSSMAAWLLVAQRFASDGASFLSLNQSLTVSATKKVSTKITCAQYCTLKGCPAFDYQGGVCTVYSTGADASPAMQRSFRSVTELVNVACNKSVKASKQYSSEVAAFGNDCNLQTRYVSRVGEKYAWWNVDLERPVSVHGVRIYPDYGSYSSLYRFHHVEVSVGMDPAEGDASTYTILGHFTGPFENSSCCSLDFFIDSAVTARYVNVRRTTALDYNQDYLIMKEVEVLTTKL